MRKIFLLVRGARDSFMKILFSQRRESTWAITVQKSFQELGIIIRNFVTVGIYAVGIWLYLVVEIALKARGTAPNTYTFQHRVQSPRRLTWAEVIME